MLFPRGPPGDDLEGGSLDRRVFLQRPFRPKLFLETVARPSGLMFRNLRFPMDRRQIQRECRYCFEERLDLIHYSARRKFTHLLQDIQAQAPLMVKFNKRRAGQYDLTVGEYARCVAEIKGAYQRRLEARGAR